MARIKPDPHVVEDRDQAECALAEIAALDRKLKGISTVMQESIDLAKAKASQEANPLLIRRKELADAVAVFAKLNRQTLFVGAKSLDLGFGVIGFRASTRIVQIRGVTAEMTLERLHQYNLADGIRTKEEINKEAALAWSDERLELVGMRRQLVDSFYIEIKTDSIPQKGVKA
ncbi:host-nuclease inhibitor Gam family protein [uncultured Desulfovibrio sp.]|uniref:host-nuclease inhibitor Gam family protein n=1 Tax=uncultured Desulfovibrio sp. TaxID=167968 RepID=UPI0025E1E6AF|nr:host-nuclease inhibitor Gam family protein [uncultured Desulfovibrio sp.]